MENSEQRWRMKELLDSAGIDSGLASVDFLLGRLKFLGLELVPTIELQKIYDENHAQRLQIVVLREELQEAHEIMQEVRP